MVRSVTALLFMPRYAQPALKNVIVMLPHLGRNISFFGTILFFAWCCYTLILQGEFFSYKGQIFRPIEYFIKFLMLFLKMELHALPFNL